MKIDRRGALKSGGALGIFVSMGTACSKNGAKSGGETDLAKLDAVETAVKIKRKEVSALEVTNAAIERAEKINPKINAIVTETFDAAREQAGKSLSGPLAGIPTFVKDLNDVIGVPTGNGSNAFARNVPTSQFGFVDDLLGTGVISLGKSSTPEFGLTATTEPASSGVTRNPWNLKHSTGGSSGGAGALVASGVVPIAHASDGGGSIRIPASCCGTVGLKVSNDRYRPARDESQIPVRISVQGCESRTVRDTAAFLAAMEFKNGPLDSIGLVTGPNKKRLKIGYFIKPLLGSTLNPDVQTSIENTAKLCNDLGHNVENAGMPIDAQIADDFLLYWASFANAVVSGWEAASGITATTDHFERFTFGLQKHFRSNQDKIGSAVVNLISYKQTYAEAFDGYDVLLCPVLTAPPPQIGYLSTDIDYDKAIERLLNYAQYTSVANTAGAPSLSLPLGMSKGGLPIGSLFNAKVGDEKMLLELAYEIEEAAPWIGRVPDVFAS